MTMKAHLSTTSSQGTERGTVLHPLPSVHAHRQHASQGCTSCTQQGKHPLAFMACQGFTHLLARWEEETEREGCCNYPISGFLPRTGHFFQKSYPENNISAMLFERTAQCRRCQWTKEENKLQGTNRGSAARAEAKHIGKTGDIGAKQGGELIPP